MICPDCGHYRKATASMVSRAKSGNISALCPGCHSRYIVTSETVTQGDKEKGETICRVCRCKPAEPGMKLCIECWSRDKDSHEMAKRKKAVEKERSERHMLKPKKSIDELNAEAAAHNMSYGKYVAMLYMKELKGGS